MKIWFQRLGLAGASLVVALLVAEFVVRLTIHVPRGTPYVAENPDTVYYNKPNVHGSHVSPGEFNYPFETNSNGCRSPNLGSKQAGVHRILCLGDSFTFGYGVGDTESWPAQLERLLNISGKKSEVANSGVSGWGLAEYWIWTSLHASEVHPDLIVIGCHASDWENAANGLISLGADGTLKRHQVVRKDVSRFKKIAEHIPLYDTLMTHSAIANLLKQSVIRVTNEGTTRGTGDAGGSTDGLDRTKDQFEALVPINRALVRGLQRVATDSGASLLVLFIPSYEELEPPGHPSAGYRLFRERLGAWAQELNIPYLDTTPLLREHLKKHGVPVSTLYHLKDQHCTTTGYHVIAQGISEEVSRHPELLTGSKGQQTPDP